MMLFYVDYISKISRIMVIDSAKVLLWLFILYYSNLRRNWKLLSKWKYDITRHADGTSKPPPLLFIILGIFFILSLPFQNIRLFYVGSLPLEVPPMPENGPVA